MGDSWPVLQLGFWIVMTICNSLATHCNSTYFYRRECYWTSCMNCNKCNALYNVKLYTYVIHVTQMQLCRYNYCATLIQLVCNYHSNVMLTSLFIDPSKFDTWPCGDFLAKLFSFWNVNFHHPLWLFIYNGFILWHMAQSKVPMGHINWDLKIKLN